MVIDTPTMRFLLITCFILFTQHVNAQTSKWELGLKVMNGFSSVYTQADWVINLARPSFSYGVQASYSVNEDISIESGAFYFDRGFTITVAQRPGVQPITSVKSREIQKYLMVPISVVTRFDHFYVGLGSNVNYYLSRRVYLGDRLVSRDKSYQPHSVLAGAQISVGYNLDLQNGFTFQGEFYGNPTLAARFINYGLGIGTRYRLGNK